MTIKLKCDNLFQDLIAAKYHRVTVVKTEDGLEISSNSALDEALIKSRLKSDPHVQVVDNQEDAK